MTDILKHLDVRVRCGQCGNYTISAAVVAESQHLLEEGCPGSPHECPPQLFATLVDPAALQALKDAWREVEASVRRRAEELLIRDRLQVEMTVEAAIAAAAAPAAGAPSTGVHSAPPTARVGATMFKSLRPPRPETPGGLVDLLLECHGRIRSFVALARQAASHVDAPHAEVVAACLRVERYFTVALPLHVTDEEQSVLPRIVGRSPDVDRALQAMREQHSQHEPKLRALLDASVAVRDAPADAERRAALAAAAEELDREFGEHLALEETVIFPAIGHLLSAAEQEEITAELRARRRVAPAAPPA